jgi:hypothetical protein
MDVREMAGVGLDSVGSVVGSCERGDGATELVSSIVRTSGHSSFYH